MTHHGLFSGRPPRGQRHPVQILGNDDVAAEDCRGLIVEARGITIGVALGEAGGHERTHRGTRLRPGRACVTVCG